jgi:hypothetical protein
VYLPESKHEYAMQISLNMKERGSKTYLQMRKLRCHSSMLGTSFQEGACKTRQYDLRYNIKDSQVVWVEVSRELTPGKSSTIVAGSDQVVNRWHRKWFSIEVSFRDRQAEFS